MRKQEVKSLDDVLLRSLATDIKTNLSLVFSSHAVLKNWTIKQPVTVIFAKVSSLSFQLLPFTVLTKEKQQKYTTASLAHPALQTTSVLWGVYCDFLNAYSSFRIDFVCLQFINNSNNIQS